MSAAGRSIATGQRHTCRTVVFTFISQPSLTSVGYPVRSPSLHDHH